MEDFEDDVINDLRTAQKLYRRALKNIRTVMDTPELEPSMEFGRLVNMHIYDLVEYLLYRFYAGSAGKHPEHGEPPFGGSLGGLRRWFVDHLPQL